MLFTFPSRYLSTIGRQVVFSLGRRSSRIPTGFLVSRGTWVQFRGYIPFAYRAITLYGPLFQTVPLGLYLFRRVTAITHELTHNPHAATLAGLHNAGLGWSPFARRYSGNHCCFLFLQVLRCFSSLGSLRTPMYSAHGHRLSPAGLPHSDISGLSPV